jgi:hypothetical protein
VFDSRRGHQKYSIPALELETRSWVRGGKRLRLTLTTRWDGLTFDAEGEIIIALRGLQRYPRGGLILFSPLRIYSSFIIGSCLLRIRNS